MQLMRRCYSQSRSFLRQEDHPCCEFWLEVDAYQACLKKSSFVKVGTLHPDAQNLDVLVKAGHLNFHDLDCGEGKVRSTQGNFLSVCFQRFWKSPKRSRDMVPHFSRHPVLCF